MFGFIRAISTLGSACGIAIGTSDGHVRPVSDPNPVLLGGDPFDREQYSAGLTAGGVDGLDLSDRPFYPEIYYDGEYHPICGIDFNDEAAARACRDIDRLTEAKPTLNKQSMWEQERFTYGGRVVKTNVILDRDAMPVGACFNGEALGGCTAGGNAFGDFTALDGRCQKGNPVGVQIICQRQCRKFEQRQIVEEHHAVMNAMGAPIQVEPFTEIQPGTGILRRSHLQACAPYLKNTTTYYLEDQTFQADNAYFDSRIAQFGALLDEMGQKCSANVVELICHSVFKECKEVNVEDPLTGGVSSVLLPSLLCKSECERHKVLWDECYAKIQTDSADKELFNSNMQAMSQLMSDVHKGMTGHELPTGPDGSRSPFSLLDCDAKGGNAVNDVPDEEVAASWILGRYHQTDFYLDIGRDDGIIGWAFPRFMTSEMLYPEEFSTYTTPDGVSYEVPCTVPGQADALEEIMCSPPFINSILPETNRACVHVCPVGQFSDAEYTTMWAVFVLIGMFSFFLNLFMVITWTLTGWQKFQATPYQLKKCVFFGLLYGIVETIPTLVLKFDLPCRHPTEEEIGSSAWCYINRSGQYMLLGIMVNLCTLTIMIFRGLVNSTGHESNTLVNVLSTAVPFLFMVIAYFLETGGEDTENYYLNVARHGFNCSMRFSNMTQEWLVLWLPFCMSCLLTAVFSFGCWLKIGDIESMLRKYRPNTSGAPNGQSQGQSPLAGQRRRLIRIAAMASVCLLLNLALVGQATVEQAAWTDYEEKKLDCLIKTGSTRNFKDYGFNEQDAVEDVCLLPDTHRCTTKVDYVKQEHPLEESSAFTSACGWYPSRRTSSLQCNFHKLLELHPDDIIEKYHPNRDIASPSEDCECPCSNLLDVVERPSPFAMTVSFGAQSLVAAIVALSLGLKDENLRIWKQFETNE